VTREYRPAAALQVDALRRSRRGRVRLAPSCVERASVAICVAGGSPVREITG
jgi:hypothetical protein